MKQSLEALFARRYCGQERLTRAISAENKKIDTKKQHL